LFNSLYTQNAAFDNKRVSQPDYYNGRANYFTSFLQATFGLHPRINLGVDLQFRSASRDTNRGSSALQVFRFGNHTNHQTKLASVGPKIKFIPFKKWPSLSVQSTFYIPVAKDLEGNKKSRIFLDYDKINWWTQLFIDQRLNPRLNLFYGFDVIYRIGNMSNGGGLLQTPLTFIITTFPSRNFTLYALGQYYPTHQKADWNDSGTFNNQYFMQIGIGTKFIIGSRLELELAYNKFVAGKNSGEGQTFNVGIRYIKR